MNDSIAQFQLRTLFVLTAICGVVLWMLFGEPHLIGMAAICVVYCLMPAVTLAGIVFHRGYWQAFFIGMAPWVVAMTFTTVLPGPQFRGIGTQPVFLDPPILDFLAGTDQVLRRKVAVLATLFVAASSGLVAVAIRWWALRLQSKSN